jgi:hypothetical protein
MIGGEAIPLGEAYFPFVPWPYRQRGASRFGALRNRSIVTVNSALSKRGLLWPPRRAK